MSKCPQCGSEYFEVREDNTCLSCGWQRKTVFDHITQSVETLAPCFVEKQTDTWDDVDYPYYSCLTKEWYATEEKAIAATVARLKEVCD